MSVSTTATKTSNESLKKTDILAKLDFDPFMERNSKPRVKSGHDFQGSQSKTSNIMTSQKAVQYLGLGRPVKMELDDDEVVMDID